MPLQYKQLNKPTSQSIPLSKKLIRVSCFTVFLIIAFLSILSLIAYLSPFRGATRPCLPFSFSRLSSSAHRKLSCSATDKRPGLDTMTIVNGESGNGVLGNRLGDFLLSQREAFLGDVHDGNLKGWTVVMGNEAGDLDSLASSIAYSYLSTSLLAERAIPLVLTPSNYMHLRPENLLAFKMAHHLDPSVFLHADKIPGSSLNALQNLAQLGANFALVDHNKLLPQFGAGNVTAIIDHHEDEHAHPDAGLRLIRLPIGSCSSLVTKHFRPQWEATLNAPAGPKASIVPSEVATLLLSAILIDTGGLKSGGKGTPTDQDSAAFLYPISNLPDPAQALSGDSHTPTRLNEIFTSLSKAKQDVGALSTNDLLLRDYKEYILPTASSVYPTLKAGLSTVPVGLKPWLEKDSDGWKSLLAGVEKYMEDRELDVEGVLTTFTSKSGKHKRELLLVTKSGHALDVEQAKKVMADLEVGFEASSELVLADWENPVKVLLHKRIKLDSEKNGRFGKVWKQENKRATRKQVAPLLRDVVARLQ